MFNMFDFISMVDNYEERKVANDEINDAVIDTVSVTDAKQPFETGIQHPFYKNGDWVIVEMYKTKEKAERGHKKWVKKFKKELPKELKDVSTASISLLGKKAGMKSNYKKEN